MALKLFDQKKRSKRDSEALVTTSDNQPNRKSKTSHLARLSKLSTDGSGFLSILELAQALHVHRNVVLNWIGEGQFEGVIDLRTPRSCRACLRIPIAAIREFHRTRRRMSPATHPATYPHLVR